MTGALDVLHCDNHVLAVRKPAGLPTVPDASGDESLLDRARAWVEAEFAKPGRAWLGVVHRLDRPVSGVVVLARTSKAAARLSAQVAGREMIKIYWGVGRGSPPADSGELRQWLVKDERKNRVRAHASPEPGAREACTAWRVLGRTSGRTLYELRPSTGRSHQLRAAAAALGTPLLGDLKYGDREPLPDKSIALHARSLALEHPTSGETLTFVAPAPGLSCWDFPACRAPG